MSETREENTAKRQRLKAEYGRLFDETAALLFRHDPMRINFDTNLDEYEPEVGTILPRLRGCCSANEACRVVHEEFVHWFEEDESRPREHYRAIAAEVWDLWTKFNAG